MKTQTISIIGLNRAGASLGLAIKAALPDVVVVGYDRDGKTAKAAKDMGAVDKTRLNIISVAAEGDIVVLALPFSEMEETMRLIGEDIQPHSVVMDMGTLKVPMQRWADVYLKHGHYVAVMPIFAADKLTDTRQTIEAATANLFRNSVFCLMPSTHVDEAAVQTAANFGKLLGAESFFLDAAEFDAYVQAIETVPALASAALFRTVTASKAWRDLLRFSGLTFAQATSALNRESDIAHLAFVDKLTTLRWLDDFIKNMVEMRRWVSEGDRESLAALLTELNIQRDEWLHERRENNWNEAPNPDVERPSFVQQFLLGSRRFDRKDGTDKKK